MASANGRPRSSQPLGHPDALVDLGDRDDAGTGRVYEPGPIPPREDPAIPAGGVPDNNSDPSDDSPEAAYATVKSAMLRVRQPYGMADDPLRGRHKRLWAFLTDRELPGGKRREVPRVTVVAISGGWRATITCYLLSMKFEVDFRHLGQLYDALSTAFTNPDAKWVEIAAGEGAKIRKEEERKRLAAQSDEVYDAVKGGRKAPSGTNS